MLCGTYKSLLRTLHVMLLLAIMTTRPSSVVRAFTVRHQHQTPASTSVIGQRYMSSTEESSDVKSDRLESFRNRNNIRDQVFSAISGDGGIKVTVLTLRNLLNDLSIKQSMSPVSLDALGRSMACGLLMSNGMQAEQTVQITMNSDGPLRGVVSITNGAGHVKGYVGTPELGEMSLPLAVGKGAVQIVKNHPDWPTPYNGITAIQHGDIDRDIGIYLAESEQRSCALAAATAFNGILCTAAGAYLIEQLPDVEPEVVEKVEKNLGTLVKKDGTDSLPTGLLLQGVTPLDICEIILDGLDMQPLQQIEPKMVCECSDDRLFRSLRLLPREEVEDILEKEERIEARCHFCGKVYRMEANELRKRLDTAEGDPSRD